MSKEKRGPRTPPQPALPSVTLSELVINLETALFQILDSPLEPKTLSESPPKTMEEPRQPETSAMKSSEPKASPEVEAISKNKARKSKLKSSEPETSTKSETESMGKAHQLETFAMKTSKPKFSPEVEAIFKKARKSKLKSSEPETLTKSERASKGEACQLETLGTEEKRGPRTPPEPAPEAMAETSHPETPATGEIRGPRTPPEVHEPKAPSPDTLRPAESAERKKSKKKRKRKSKISVEKSSELETSLESTAAMSVEDVRQPETPLTKEKCGPRTSPELAPEAMGDASQPEAPATLEKRGPKTSPKLAPVFMKKVRQPETSASDASLPKTPPKIVSMIKKKTYKQQLKSIEPESATMFIGESSQQKTRIARERRGPRTPPEPPLPSVTFSELVINLETALFQLLGAQSTQTGTSTQDDVQPGLQPTTSKKDDLQLKPSKKTSLCTGAPKSEAPVPVSSTAESLERKKSKKKRKRKSKMSVEKSPELQTSLESAAMLVEEVRQQPETPLTKGKRGPRTPPESATEAMGDTSQPEALAILERRGPKTSPKPAPEFMKKARQPETSVSEASRPKTPPKIVAMIKKKTCEKAPTKSTAVSIKEAGQSETPVIRERRGPRTPPEPAL